MSEQKEREYEPRARKFVCVYSIELTLILVRIPVAQTEFHVQLSRTLIWTRTIARAFVRHVPITIRPETHAQMDDRSRPAALNMLAFRTAGSRRRMA